MMLVNHRVVLTQAQATLLALGAEPQNNGEWWMHDAAVSNLYSLPVLVALDDGTPVDCGDGWLAVYKPELGSLYAWNDAEIKAKLEEVVRESSFRSFANLDFGRNSIGLFQQQPHLPITGITS